MTYKPAPHLQQISVWGTSCDVIGRISSLGLFSSKQKESEKIVDESRRQGDEHFSLEGLYS